MDTLRYAWTLLQGSSGEGAPPILGDRLRNVYDGREIGQATLTGKLPVEIAATAQQLEEAERALAQAPHAGAVELGVVATFALLAVGVDAALTLEPAASYAGILLSDLGTASAGELAAVVSLPLLAGGFNLIGGLAAGDLLVRGQALAGVGATGALVLTAGTLAVIRVGEPTDLVDAAEIGFFTVAPAGLALFVGVLGARCRVRAEPAQQAAREAERCRRRLATLRGEERVAWSERTRAAAMIDRVVPENLPLVVPTAESGTELSPWITTALVIVALGLVAFVAAGCTGGEAPRAEAAPSVLTLLVDTSPSMKGFDFGQIAGDAVRAGEASGFLAGGSVLSAYRTTEDSVAMAYDGSAVPRRFPGKEKPEVLRERWFDGVEAELEAAAWPEGDSAVLRGLARVGESLELLPAERKVVVLASDCRDHLDGHHYFGKRVPKPDEVVRTLTNEGLVPDLAGVTVIACGMGDHPNEDGSPFGSRQNAAVAEVMQAVVSAGGGAFRRIPSCTLSDLTLALKAEHDGGRK